MQITFEMAFDTQLITLEELNEFQTMIGKTLPEDYRQHMLTYNGGDVEEINNAHVSDPEGGGGENSFSWAKILISSLYIVVTSIL